MLEIENLCKTFNKGTLNENIVFENFNFSVKNGEFLTILGGNGSGKSTLMKLISGAIFPDSGKISIGGKDMTKVREFKRAKLVGHLFQDPLKGTAPNLTVEENLMIAINRGKHATLRFAATSKDENFMKEKLAELELNLENRLKTKVGLLSGGQRQAITLLMATLAKPKLLLLDEHTAALDPSAVDKILKITKKIVDEDKITTIMITHNINIAKNFGTRHVMLKPHGQLAELDMEKLEKMERNEIIELFG
jgi:putative ABC transport system ATP-binding protein